MNGTETIAEAGPYPYTSPMTATRIGYARCSTDRQDPAAQRQALLELGVAEDRSYTDHGLTGTTRARPDLDQALAAVRAGDTLLVPKLDRLARSVPDARHRRSASGTRRETGPRPGPLRPGRSHGKDVLQYPRHLRRVRSRSHPHAHPRGYGHRPRQGEIARHSKQPKLSDRQQRELCRMHVTGEYSISDLAELFSVSRPTVYRTLNRRHSP